MNNFEDKIKNMEESAEWSRDIARKVLAKRAGNVKRARLILLSVATLLIMASAGISYRVNQTAVFKATLNSVLSEALPDYYGDHIISKTVDEKIAEYCFNTEE